MINRQYRRAALLAIALVLVCAGCGVGQPPPPTTLPFNRYRAEAVLAAFRADNVAIQNEVASLDVAPDVPATFVQRVTFEIPLIAPQGGQVFIFTTPENQAEFLAYIERQRASAATRRNVVYVYAHANVVLQLSPSLTNDQAARFRSVLEALP
jgi:hypothetical protein